MKVLIDKELLDKLIASVEVKSWLDSVPKKHRKFAAYWDEIGRPELETSDDAWCKWYKAIPNWDNSNNYRIKDDPHWELRLKWVNSDKTLSIEYKNTDNKWEPAEPFWLSDYQYREVKPWYEQEISRGKPILLRWRGDFVELWTTFPDDYESYDPLTDDEIESLKRGF